MYKYHYDNKISIYYQKLGYKEVCKHILNYFWLNNDQELEKNLELVSNKKGKKVFSLMWNNSKYYIKKYKYKRVSKKVQSIIRKPEGNRNFSIALELLESGLSTATPIFGLIKKNLITYDSIYVTKEATGVTLKKYIQEKLYEKDKLIKRLAKLWGEFTKYNFIHQDPTPDNLIIKNNDNLQFSFIDLDDVYSPNYVPEIVTAHAVSRFIAKIYINIWSQSRVDLFEEGGLELFLEEFVKSHSKSINKESFILKIKHLILKKVIKRSKKLLINNKTLSKLYSEVRLLF